MFSALRRVVDCSGGASMASLRSSGVIMPNGTRSQRIDSWCFGGKARPHVNNGMTPPLDVFQNYNKRGTVDGWGTLIQRALRRTGSRRTMRRHRVLATARSSMAYRDHTQHAQGGGQFGRVNGGRKQRQLLDASGTG